MNDELEKFSFTSSETRPEWREILLGLFLTQRQKQTFESNCKVNIMSEIKSPLEIKPPVIITETYEWTLVASKHQKHVALNWDTNCPGALCTQIKIYEDKFQDDPAVEDHRYVDGSYSQPWKTDIYWGADLNIGWIGRSWNAWHYIVKTTTDHSGPVKNTEKFQYTLKAYGLQGYLTIDFSKTAGFDLGAPNEHSYIKVYKNGFPVDLGEGDNTYSALEPKKTYQTKIPWSDGWYVAWIVMGVDGKWHYLVQLTT